MTFQHRLQLGLFLFIVFFNLQFVTAQKDSRLGLEEKKNSNSKRNKSYQ